MPTARSRARSKPPIAALPTRLVKKNRPPVRNKRWLVVGALCVIVVVAFSLLLLRQLHRSSTASVLAQRTVKLTTLDPNFLQQINICLFPVAHAYGYRLDIASGFRSMADQQALYAQGRTAPGDIVTYARGGESLHNYGLAIDVVDDVKSYDLNWDMLGKIGQYCGLEHGDRGHEDLPHFQYRGGLSLDNIKEGMRPVRLRIPCSLLAARYSQHQNLSRADLRQCGADTF